MASRCAFVIRGAKSPCVVDCNSITALLTGVVVPTPALPDAGKILVCADNFV